MEIPSTQRRTNEFDRRNLVLQVALGGVAFAEKLDQLLREHGRGPARVTQAQPSPEDQELVFFVLGLVALRRRFGELVDVGRREPQPPRFEDECAKDVSLPSSRELLR